jgi:hypothetical protein
LFNSLSFSFSLSPNPWWFHEKMRLILLSSHRTKLFSIDRSLQLSNATLVHLWLSFREFQAKTLIISFLTSRCNQSSPKITRIIQCKFEKGI